MTEMTERPPARPTRARQLSDLGTEVGRRIDRLQTAVMADRSQAVATVAQLRHSVTKEPGSVPAIWELTVDGLPGRIYGDEPTYEERAAHAAMTLYAVHQQSRDQPMHQSGVGFGQAARRLAARDGNRGDDEKPVRRRFNAAATATTLAEALHHLRGLVGQLRQAKIPLDYAMFADDLFIYQFPDGADTVRRRWGRQYYAFQPKSTDDADTAEQKTAEQQEDHQ